MIILLALTALSSASDLLPPQDNHEVITITALKRETKLQETAIAASVYNQSDFASVGALTLSDIEQLMPSVNFGAADRRTRGEVVIRGIGGFSRNIGVNARAGVYIDGVYIGRSSGFDLDLGDVAQVEVLRGPQGTLFGKNTVSGAINLITAKPDAEFSRNLQITLGNNELQSFSGHINGALNDSLYSSLHYSNTRQQGFVTNTLLDRSLNGINRDSVRLKLRQYVNDNLEINVSLDGLNERSNATNYERLDDDIASDNYAVAHNADEFEKRDYWGTSVNVAWSLENEAGITSITAFREMDHAELNEEDYSPLDIGYSLFNEFSSQLSQEFRYTSPLTEHYDYVLGLFYFDQEISTERQVQGGEHFIIPFAGVRVPGRIGSQTLAAFGHGNYRFDNYWEISAGLRYTIENKDVIYNLLDTGGLYTSIENYRDKMKSHQWQPKVSINYHADNNALSYFQIARGYASGGWNVEALPTLEHFRFKPEYVTSYELGHKTSLLDQRLTVNSALFYSRFNDYQIFQFSHIPGSGTILNLTNAGKVTSQGVEVESRYSPHEQLTFTTSFTWQDARFDQFLNGDTTGTDYSGHRLPYAPKLKAYVGAQYRTVVDNGELSATFGYTYSSRYFTHASNEEATFGIAPLRNLDARIAFTFDTGWQLSVWGKNLTDERELRHKGLSFLNIPRGIYTTPREYGLSISYQM